MELRILDSIIHGVLKPWMIDTSNNKRFTDLVKAAKKVDSSTNRELHTQLYNLLADFPTLQKVLETEIEIEKKLQPLYYNINLPMYTNAVTNFYYLVITLESQRIYNRVLEYTKIYTNKIDFAYQTGKVLNYVKVLATQASIEIELMGFSGTQSQVETSNYVIHFLKHTLIQLYFSIQEQFKDRLEDTTTLEDFYLLDLQEPLTGMLPLEKVHLIENDKPQEKLSFGFNGDAAKLKNVLTQLNSGIELLDVEISSVETLHTLLTQKIVIPNSVKIQFGCETVQLRYIIDKLKPYFNTFNPQNIELSECFYTKNGTLIKAQNLYTNKISNPKKKDKIDNIIKHLQ